MRRASDAGTDQRSRRSYTWSAVTRAPTTSGTSPRRVVSTSGSSGMAAEATEFRRRAATLGRRAGLLGRRIYPKMIGLPRRLGAVRAARLRANLAGRTMAQIRIPRFPAAATFAAALAVAPSWVAGQSPSTTPDQNRRPPASTLPDDRSGGLTAEL